MPKDRIKKEYDDWISLLERRHAKELLDDPYNVWLEAWTVCSLLANQVKASSSDHARLEEPPLAS